MTNEPAQRMEIDEHLSGAKAIEKVRELLSKFRAGMLVTRAIEADEIHARPIALQGDAASFDGTLWFFADDRSRKAREIERSASASVMFQSDEDSRYLQLAGAATVVPDRSKMKELFTIRTRTWFPQGLDGPHLVLIRFDAAHGWFWDNPGGTIQVLAAFAKAIVTGTPGRTGRAGEMKM